MKPNDASIVMSIGERLASERKRLGWQQVDMARRGDVGRATQTRYETGVTSPPADYLARLAAHGVDIAYVLTGERRAVVPAALTPEEAALVDNYRAAGERGRAAARAVLDALTQPGSEGRKVSGE